MRKIIWKLNIFIAKIQTKYTGVIKKDK